MLVAGDDDIGSESLNDSPARWVLLRPFIRWKLRHTEDKHLPMLTLHRSNMARMQPACSPSQFWRSLLHPFLIAGKKTRRLTHHPLIQTVMTSPGSCPPTVCP